MDYENLYISALNYYYPDIKERKEAESMLSTYGSEEYHLDKFRVRSAILKLSENDLTRVHHYLEQSLSDYRDVICWAEYPQSFKWWDLKNTNPERYKELEANDINDYLDWLSQVL